MDTLTVVLTEREHKRALVPQALMLIQVGRVMRKMEKKPEEKARHPQYGQKTLAWPPIQITAGVFELSHLGVKNSSQKPLIWRLFGSCLVLVA